MHPDTDFSKMMLNAINDNTIKYKVIFRVVSANTYVVSIDAPPDRVSDLKKIIASNETVRFAGYGFKTEKIKNLLFTLRIYLFNSMIIYQNLNVRK